MRLLSLAVFLAFAWWWMRGPDIPRDGWLVLDLSGNFSEARPGGLLLRLFDQGRTMSELDEMLRKVRHDGRIKGVIVRIGSLDAGWAQAQEIRAALALVKAGGKKVISEIEVELAPASKEIYLASVADRVYVSPSAAPLLTGLKATAVFLGGVWPKIDVALQVEQLREYKSAGEELSRESMSPAHREMLESLLDEIGSELARTVSTSRNVAPAVFEKAIAAGLSRPHQFVEAGLADAVRSHQEVLSELGDGKPAVTVRDKDYARVTPASLGIGTGPAVAVIHATGGVHSGRSRPGGGDMGSRTIAEAIAQAARDGSVSAIVLRISSPGGSPAASDEIWLAIRDAAKKKPVIASLGDVAASGGYYIASAADRVVAAPGTLTGSIGVVFFKPDVSALLGRAGIRTETLQRGRYARLLDLDKKLDAEELALVRLQLEDIYRIFLERVATGRKKKVEEIDRVAGGRVWTGKQAYERGLVDEIGTFEDAVRAAANAAGVHDTDKVKLVHYPRGESFAEQLAEAGMAARASTEPAVIARLAALLGDKAALLELEPGIQAVAETLPDIE
jgi:protease-4